MTPKIFLSSSTEPVSYASALRAVGCEPFGGLLAPADGDYDGLLLCGGVDVNPARYGEERNGAAEPNDLRDEYEIALIRHFLAEGKPIFGICRGSQILTVACGGSLIQDIGPKEIHAPEKRHIALAAKGSIVEKLYGKRFQINSLHHEATKIPGEGMMLTAFSENDRIVEAYEHKNLPVFAVQWHPERIWGEKGEGFADGLKLFSYFATLCGVDKE